MVTDLWLGHDRGGAWQNIARLRDATPGAPFLLLTGHGAALEEGRRAGYAVLLKPFDVEDFEHTIRELLST